MKTIIMIATGIVFFAYLFLDSGNQSGYDRGAQTVSNVDAYGSRGGDNTWPQTNGNSPVSADDLLAANYVIVIDGSGSMDSGNCSDQGSRLDAAKRATLSFLSAIPPTANAGVFAFDDSGIGARLNLAHHSGDEYQRALGGLVANGGTPLRTSINAAASMLEAQAQRQLGYGEYHLVVVTDGAPSDGEDPTGIINQIVSKTPINIHTIGFCIDDHHPLNQPGVTAYYKADDEQSLTKGLEAVVAEAPTFDVTQFTDGNNG